MHRLVKWKSHLQGRISDFYGESRGDDEDDDIELELSGCMKMVQKIQFAVSEFYTNNKQTIKTFFFVILLLLFVAYFITAIVKVRSQRSSLCSARKRINNNAIFSAKKIPYILTFGLTNMAFSIVNSHDFDNCLSS